MDECSDRAAERTGVASSEANLKEVAAVYHALIEWLPQRVFFKDTQSVFVSVNALFARDFGATPASLIGKSDFDLFPEALARKYQEDDQRIMHHRQAETLEEANVIDGRQRVVEVVKTPVLDRDGGVLGLLGVFTDITERKQAELKLKDFAAHLQRRNRELQDFAYVASHDLQEPLRKVAVFGDRLREKCGAQLSAEGQDYLDRMLKATKRMQTLIDDLLTFTRVATQAKPFARVDLAVVVQEVLQDLETRIDPAQTHLDIGALPVVEADATQMRQLFQNLIGNALKFRRVDTPLRVTIQADTIAWTEPGETREPARAEAWRITVADNGIGFDNQYAERIFHVFQRLHSRSEYAGSGIGLAICRRIVERHGGDIVAQGTLGEGATFTIRIPKRRPMEALPNEC